MLAADSVLDYAAVDSIAHSDATVLKYSPRVSVH